MRRVSDAVHGTIQLDPVQADLIDTRAFQRLRNIKQLGLANLVFPGADYSRLAHCIGVSHVTGRILAGLADSGVKIEDKDRALYRAAALLHDIGHYPFSHATEHAVENHYKSKLIMPVGAEAPAGGEGGYWNHEQVGTHVIAHDQEVVAALKRHDVDPDEIVQIISHAKIHPQFANLVSSDLDADRIDYLMRTAYHTGLPYGDVDLEYLLTQIRVDDAGRLCLDRRAMRTAEHFLLGRYFDYQQVSWHKTVAAFELALNDLVGAVLRRNLLSCSAEEMKERIASGHWYVFDDGFLTQLLRRLATSTPKDDQEALDQALAQALILRRPPRLIADREGFEENNPERASDHNLAVRMARERIPGWAKASGIPEQFWWVWDRRSKLTKIGSMVPASKAAEAGDEVEEALDEAIRIQLGDGSSRPIGEVSRSLMIVLSNYSLNIVRIYALPPSGLFEEGQREEVTSMVLEDLADQRWT